jgi:hypothetical protein
LIYPTDTVDLFHKLAKYFDLIALVWAALGTVWAAYEHFWRIAKLRRERDSLQGEIDDLQDEKHSESAKHVARILVSVNPPMCGVCKELLLLRFSTTFASATQLLVNLPGVVAQAATTHGVDMGLVLGTLEKAAHANLWPTELDISTDKDTDIKSAREDAEWRRIAARALITQAIEAYVWLIPNMQEAKEIAVRFCIGCCDRGSPELKIQAARRLLPHLLVESGGDPGLVQTYRNLLATGLTGLHTEEQKMLLIAVFGGLQVSAAVASTNVHDIWEQAFLVATRNVEWAWEGEGAKVGTSWCIAIENRLRYLRRSPWSQWTRSW